MKAQKFQMDHEMNGYLKEGYFANGICEICTACFAKGSCEMHAKPIPQSFLRKNNPSLLWPSAPSTLTSLMHLNHQSKWRNHCASYFAIRPDRTSTPGVYRHSAWRYTSMLRQKVTFQRNTLQTNPDENLVCKTNPLW